MSRKTKEEKVDWGDEGGGWALSRRATMLLVSSLVGFIAVMSLVINGLKPVDRWSIAALEERMGLEGLGVDPHEGQTVPVGLIGATEKSTVSIVLGTRVHLMLDHDTRIFLGRSPGRWLRRAASVRIDQGTIRLAPGISGAGVPLHVYNEAGSVRASDAVFAVSSSQGSLCVSVGKGAVTFEPESGGAIEVSAGSRVCVDASGHAGGVDPVDATERERLAQFAALRLEPVPEPSVRLAP